MAEVPVAHFTLRWEADYARGFLEDSGIPCRLQEAALGAGGFYAGDLHGASLLVPEGEFERAREALESAGVLQTDEAAAAQPPPLLERDLPPVMRSDVTDIQEALEAAKRKANRHGIYAVLGFTPAALIPLTGLVLQGNGGLVALLGLLVVVREIRRWIGASREITRLELLLMEMADEADDVQGDTHPGPDRPGPGTAGSGGVSG